MTSATDRKDSLSISLVTAGLVAATTLNLCSCGTGGGEPGQVFTPEDYAASAQDIVEDKRVTLGVIESVVPCEISGEIPAPDPQDEQPPLGWHELLLITQSVERSWGPELADGTASTLIYGDSSTMESDSGLVEVGRRGMLYAQAIEPGDVSYSCGVTPTTARSMTGDFGYRWEGQITVDEWAESLDSATPGEELAVEPLRAYWCTGEDPGCGD